MTARHLLATCRFLIAVLLCNIGSSMAMATVAGEKGSADLAFTWFCTSQGLVKVALETDSVALPAPETATNNHCPYCKFVDHPVSLIDPGFTYPQPTRLIEYHYLAPVTNMTLKPILSAVNLRAPPRSILA